MNQEWNKLEKWLNQRELPIAVLDQHWHQIFLRFKKPIGVKMLENRLNQILKRQGKAQQEINRYKGLKKDMMQKIVGGMDTAVGSKDEKAFQTMNTQGKAVEEINKRVSELEAQLKAIPEELSQANRRLIEESVTLCLNDLDAKKNRYEALVKEQRRLQDEMDKMEQEKQSIKQQYKKTQNYLVTLFGDEAYDLFEAVFEQRFGKQEKSKAELED